MSHIEELYEELLFDKLEVIGDKLNELVKHQKRKETIVACGLAAAIVGSSVYLYRRYKKQKDN